MHIIGWNELLKNGLPLQQEISLTVGVFDGVHRGHRQLIDCLKTREGTLPVVATFKSNPILLFRPDLYKGDILTYEQKLDRLVEAGCASIILIDFSPEFSKLSGRDFFNCLKDSMKLSHLVLGKDHKLGRNGDTSSEMARERLEPQGIKVDIVEPLIDGDLPVSSTRIRNSIEEGDFNTAEKLLGCRHELNIEGISPVTENNSSWYRRRDIKQVLPLFGRYAVEYDNSGFTFATTIQITEDRLIVENLPDFKSDKLKIFNLL